MSGEKSEILTNSQDEVSLGDFQYSCQTEELFDKNGNPVRLRRQSSDVLAYLACRADELVSKTELIENVWPDTFVTDDSLGQCIVDIRRALNDSEHKIIQTYPKKGYRLVPISGDESTDTTDWPKRKIAASVALVLFFIAIAAIQFWPLQPDEEAIAGLPLPDKPSIIVLPFENQSEESDIGYLAAGLSTSIRTQLSKFPQIFVIAGATSETFSDRPGTARGIGRELGVQYVLDGSIRVIGDGLAVSAELVEAEAEHTVWAEQFALSNDNGLSTQADVVSEIVSTLNVVIGEVELAAVRSRPTTSSRAYDLYLRAEAATSLSTSAGRIEALNLLKEAVDADPDYLDAHFELSGRYLSLYRFGGASDPDEAVRLSRHHAERALEISRSDYRGHFRLGMLHLFAEHDHELSFAAFRRALKDNPNDADVLYNMGFLRSLMGEPEEAIEWNDKAKRINPRYPGWYNFNAALSRFFVGDYNEAESLARTGIAEYPTSLAPRRILIVTLVELDRLDEAKREVGDYLEISPEFRLATFRNTPFQHTEDHKRYFDALRFAGIPD